jgi:hypothetical protein
MEEKLKNKRHLRSMRMKQSEIRGVSKMGESE